jgi:hypothetical protein
LSKNWPGATISDLYDKQQWLCLLRNDTDISRLADILAPYGQKYVDEFAAAYLPLNDKKYLPVILRKIVASAEQDGGQNVVNVLPEGSKRAFLLASAGVGNADRAHDFGVVVMPRALPC